MTDLKQAAQMALEALERADKDDFWREQRDAITALRTALAQPEQEPCIGKDPRCPCQDGGACHYKDCVGTKARPVAQPEQVDCPRCGHVCSQRTWQGLEAEDLAQIESDEFWQVGNHMAIATAVENKLKELNNG